MQVADLPDVRALLDADPATHCFVTARLEESPPHRAASELWGYFDDDELRSALYVGANIVPIATDTASREAFASRLMTSGRRGSSIVGPADEVMDLWDQLSSGWGRARDVRARQPLLAMATEPLIDADVHVRPVEAHELDILLPACIAMFTEEVGVSPVAGGSATAYRARIAELVRGGRALARLEGNDVIFKAEIGAVSSLACQVQGVWVHPDRRGRGLSEPGMAAVVQRARETCAPIVSLYVNDFNTIARRAYARIGFEEIGLFATILF